MEKRYQVFISSTFKDLQPARQEVSHALLRANCFPAGMELFPAADEEQFEFIKQVIDQSDFYIIISAGRYGTIHPETGLSYTEMEYDYALAVGKPIIRLLHKNPFRDLRGEFIEEAEHARNSLRLFREKMEQRSLVKHWNDHRELGQHVVLGLLDAQQRSPTTGWVRAEAETTKGKRNRIDDDDFLAAVQNAVRAYIGEVPNSATNVEKSDQAQKKNELAAVGQLAEGLSYDFNNLLTAISGHCDLLMLRHEETDEGYDHLLQINQHVNRAAALVSQLLAFSRKQVMRPELLDLPTVISDLAHLLARLVGRRLSLQYSFHPSLSSIRMDKRQFEQVLMNLVINSRDAMPDSGVIHIFATNFSTLVSKKVASGTLVPGEYVSVSVIDQGLGIACEHVEKVFEPFFSTRPEGTGLGLSAVYGIVLQSGGQVDVQSVSGKGAEFVLYFPIIDA